LREDREWQPARFIGAHNPQAITFPEEGEKAKQIIIRVTPYTGPTAHGCTLGGPFFMVHPDDVRKVCTVERPIVVCEHEIISD
jgi:hypothetical protein